jgi:Large ribosomal RNA subunit accumulation protein YceD
MTQLSTQPWRVPVALHDVPETGRRFELSADERTRAAVAEAAGLASLPRFTASFDVTRYGRDGLRVVGTVSATVGQICVVTLDLVENGLTEAVDLVFVPGAGGPPPAVANTKDAEAGEADPPERLIDGTIDLGAIATEFLILGIDPYPRRPDAAFEAPAAPRDEADHPFAALAALRQRSTRNDG